MSMFGEFGQFVKIEPNRAFKWLKNFWLIANTIISGLVGIKFFIIKNTNV